METIKTKKYYTEINIQRGILALLIVLGHILVQINETDSLSWFLASSLGNIIYSFHMPLFFMISGFVSVKSLSLKSVHEKLLYIKGRFTRLMIPYFAMGVVYFPFRIILRSIARTNYYATDFWKILIGQNPDGALWFLYALFVISIFTCLLVTEKTLPLTITVAGILSIIARFIPLPQIIDYTFYHAVFFFVGIYIRIHYEEFKDYLNRKWVVVAVLLFIFGNYMMLTSSVKYICTGSRIAAAFSGCIITWRISLVIVENSMSTALVGWIEKWLNIIGSYSMDIYMFAEPIKVVIRTIFSKSPIFVMITATFIISTALSMVVSKYFVRRVKLFKKLFLGS